MSSPRIRLPFGIHRPSDGRPDLEVWWWIRDRRFAVGFGLRDHKLYRCDI